jgi:hypothetical protein
VFHDDRVQVRHRLFREYRNTEYYDIPYRSDGDGDDDLYRFRRREPQHNPHSFCAKYADV